MPMDVFSLTSTTIPSTLTRRHTAADKPSHHLNLSKHSHSLRYPFITTLTNNRICSSNSIRAQASGSTKSSTAEGIPEKTDSKDDNLVFVAGATGKVGSRTVRELIKLGFKVRAGVRNAQKAGALVQSVKQLKLDGTSGGGEAVEKLEIVECDLEKPDQIGSALGNASTVICTIGASEKEIFDITGPCRIDYRATKSLVDAAKVAKVNHFILVTSLGTNKFGFPAAILNLFWGVLIWKRKAEEALIASGIPYTIVRPGGMERPTDAYKETHNVTLSTEDTLFGGQVSNLQVAELMATMAKNPDLSYCKIVEVIAETTAPLTPAEKLLTKIPSQRPYVSPPKKPDTATVSDPVPSANIVAEVPSVSPQKEAEQPKPVAKTEQPLSPYTAYDDLKPASSPSPTKPSDKKQINIGDSVPTPDTVNVSNPGPSTSVAAEIPSIAPLKETEQPKPVAKTEQPLSPYTAYDDLKPPSSPSPTKPSDKKPINISDAVPTPVSSDTPSSIQETDGISQTTPSSKRKESLSPYAVYPDLKPPSSPSPSVPTTSPSKIDTVVSSNGPAQLSVEDTPKDDGQQHLNEPESRPLSPYAMYEDLKPPASPQPSFRKS